MNPRPSSRSSGPKRLLQGRESLRFAVMIVLVIVLGAVVVGVLDKFYGSRTEVEREPISDIPMAIKIPKIDRELLKRVKDAEPTERLLHEGEVYEHLLVKATEIYPGTLRAMGLPETPVSVDTVRQNPERYRGRPLAFEGEIFELMRPVPIPGMSGYKKTEGFLNVDPTDPSKRVYFAVVSEIPEELVPGKFARIEGFFYKLRDFKFPEKLSRIPHIVGLELKHAFGRFEPVKELDDAVLATIEDDNPEPGDIPIKPYYHLASWVLNNKPDDAAKAAAPPLGYDEFKSILKADGNVPRGKVFRVLGELYDVEIKLAAPNPLGVKYWSRAWIKHRYETVQVNIPGRVPGGWRTGDYVVFYGAFFKRHWYEAGSPDPDTMEVQKIVPLFVADELIRWELVDNPANTWIKATLAGITLLLIGLMALLVIRDNKGDQEVRNRLLERRRKRRSGAR